MTVFGSARFKEDHPYYALGREVGRELARAGFTVMTGGGPGIMEAGNRGAAEAGQSAGAEPVAPAYPPSTLRSVESSVLAATGLVRCSSKPTRAVRSRSERWP